MIDLYSTLALGAGTGALVFFSPCAYALLPSYVGYYVAATERGGGGGRSPIGGAILRGVAALAGAIAVFAGLAAVTAALGSVLQSIVPALELLVGVLLVILGAVLLADVSIDVRVPLPRRRTSVVGFAAFGGLYALAAAGCVFPLFLSVVLQSLTLPVAGTIGTFAAFSGTFGVLLVGTTVAIAVGHDLAAANVAKYADLAVRIAGVVVIAGGLIQIFVVAT